MSTANLSYVLRTLARPAVSSYETVAMVRALSTQPAWDHTIKIENMNPCVKKMEYAVRGPLVIRANEIEKEIANVSSTSNFVLLQFPLKYSYDV